MSALAEVARGCCDELGGGAFAWASNESERRKLWAARHGTYYASLALRPGSRGIVTDAVVPISRLAEVMTATADDVERCGVVGPIFGHAGDGNFHCILLVTCPLFPLHPTSRLRHTASILRVPAAAC